MNSDQIVTAELLAGLTKVCVQCNEPKLFQRFSKHRKNRDGLQHVCKECRSFNYFNNRDKELKKALIYRSQNAEKRRAYSRSLRQKVKQDPELLRKHREYMREASRRSKAKTVLQQMARHAVGQALENGSIVRPSECFECKTICKPEGHHESYLKDNWLNVVWLCKRCHAVKHQKYKAKGTK